jgi:hypothetical protein
LTAWTSASAEPSNTINWLMNEPLTLFDYGIIKMEKRLNEDKCLFDSCTTKIDFNWNDNRIEIVKHIEMTKNVFKTTKENLKKVTNNEIISISLKFVEDNLFNYFSHKGFSKKDQPINLSDELENIVDIKVILTNHEDSYSVTCSSNLKGGGISCEENKIK